MTTTQTSTPQEEQSQPLAGGALGSGPRRDLLSALGIGNGRSEFHVERGSLTIHCSGEDSLATAVKVLDADTQRMTKAFAGALGGDIMERMKPYMSPEQRERGEQLTKRVTAPSSPVTEAGPAAEEEAPPTKTIRLRKEEIAGYDLFLECVGTTKGAALLNHLHAADDYTLTVEQLRKKMNAKKARNVTSTVAQLRNKCINAAGIEPERVLFDVVEKDTEAKGYALHERFAEYLRRRNETAE